MTQNTQDIEPGQPLENPPVEIARLTHIVVPMLRAASCIVILFPVLKRLHHPTLLGDDIVRLVDVDNNSFWSHLWLPFGDHVAPLFQLVTSITWELIGHDIRLAAIAFSAASITPWLLVLALLWLWLRRETRSNTAAYLAVALVSQSPLVLETVYWYSASSFLWSVAGVLIALWGTSLISEFPKRALTLIAVGCALAPAGTTIGLVGTPLAAIRALLQHDAKRATKVRAVIAASAGLSTFLLIFKLPIVMSDIALGVGRSGTPIDIATGLWYAVTVPGRILWPAVLGIPPSLTATPLPVWLCALLGAVALVVPVLVVAWRRPRSTTSQITLTSLAMIYGTYLLTYAPRVQMMKRGLWTEIDFLYNFAGRYHVIPLLGVAAIIASLLASLPFTRSLDQRRAIPSLAGLLTSLLLMAINGPENARWNWMLEQPDQAPTLAAVHHLGLLSLEEGIDREQLKRIFNPVFRPWNGSLVHDRPSAFHLMNLAIQAPAHNEKSLPDNEARSRLTARLTERQRSLLGSGSCASFYPATLHDTDQLLAVATRTKTFNVKEITPGKFEWVAWPAYVEYEFTPKPVPRTLVLPELDSNHDVVISWPDPAGRWLPGLNVRWIVSHPMPGAAAIDLQRLLQFTGKPISRIRVELTQPGVLSLSLSDPPRLLR